MERCNTYYYSAKLRIIFDTPYTAPEILGDNNKKVGFERWGKFPNAEGSKRFSCVFNTSPQAVPAFMTTPPAHHCTGLRPLWPYSGPPFSP